MTTQYRPPVMDRVIGVPATATREVTVLAQDLRYDQWRPRNNVVSPGQWSMDNPAGSRLRPFDSLTLFSEATRLTLTLTDVDGLELGDPSEPFALTMIWSDGRSLAYTVTASESYIVPGSPSSAGRTFTLSAVVLTGDGAAPPAGDVTVRAGTGSTTTITDDIERRIWAARRDIRVRDQEDFSDGAAVVVGDAVYTVRRLDNLKFVTGSTMTDDRGIPRRIRGVSEVGRRYLELLCRRRVDEA